MNFAVELEKNPLFKILQQAAQKVNVPAYVIGGYVRDIILGRPSKDVDIVCVGSGIALAKAFADCLDQPAQVNVFKNFGTAMVKTDLFEVEFVGARKESYDRNSRKPIVEDGTLEDDQNRRDFTINAMAFSLQTENFGELIDPFGGLEDIKRRLIKTPLEPGITYSDDPLRMMRAVRFAAQLNFDIDHDSFIAIQEQKERIKIVSGERIIDEFNKIVLAKKPSYGFKLLYHCGLLEIIFPEFTALQGVEKVNGKTHKDNFYHTLQVLDNISENTDDLWLRWSAIMHDIAKPATKRFDRKQGWTFHGHEDKGARMVKPIFRRMKLPLDERMRVVEKLVKLHLRPIALVKDSISDSAIRRLIFEAGDDLEGLMMLCRADITSKNHQRVQKYIANFNKLEKKIADVEARDQIRNFQPVITGEIIMETFGVKPSKVVGDIKFKIREAILEGELKNNYDEAYQFMLKAGKELGLKEVSKSNDSK
ncbi:CCA tRNA nucleotidyltransferase [Chondrinema litorale]|uniref:CCA tRNA nucleotidyltransferase n=1 Tax=Chondrinema litorale TaxID=2994555 RepID=UPI0025432314|nr:HD domain-containing protein [Chondrinema litorale]UZR95168.1 HD domain-containing protein [Chondrinema litorale]